MDLPSELRTGLDDVLDAVPAKRLAALAAELSGRYRTEQSASGANFLRSREDVTAYAAFRLPATYAAVYAALMQIQEQLPDWTPSTLLDVGAGPGTVMWAATSVWPDIESITLLEREEGMIALGKRLSSHAPQPSIRNATWVKADMTSGWEADQHDLVTISYALSELSEQTRETLVQKLWSLTKGTLLVIEPGTPPGFSIIKQAREDLLKCGATTVAPCPHNSVCPNDWCHFAQRISRSRLHRQVKAGALSYEDEKFSFVGVSRIKGEAVDGRVVRHPQVRSGHVHLDLCTPEGLTSMVVTRKDRERFRTARDLRWGSALPRNQTGDKG